MNKDFDILSDEYLGAAMKAEDERYFAKTSANIVPLENAKVNDCVKFGKIIWKVIGMEEGKKLLLSKDCMGMDFDWEFSQGDDNDLTDNKFGETLADILGSEQVVDYAKEAEEIKKYFREWFCDNYFLKEEVEQIEPYCVKNTIGSTFDEYVFLLSEEEVKKYIPTKEERIASMHVMFNDVARDWLLRLEDEPVERQVVVNTEGDFETVSDGYLCSWFRPAVWVKNR